MRTGIEEGAGAGYETEHQKFGELAVTDVSRKLVQIFFATNALKKDDGVPPGSAQPVRCKRLGVIGSGFMGAGIAGTAVSAAAGWTCGSRTPNWPGWARDSRRAGDILDDRSSAAGSPG